MAIKTTRKHSWPCNYTVFSCQGVGTTLEHYARCERIMSDVWDDVSYALVWDAEAGCPKAICLGVSYDRREGESTIVTIDATPEVLAAYEAWKVAEKARKDAEEAARWEAIRMAEAKQPRKGRIIKVVKGRKVPKGTTGVCIWIGQGDWGTRVGLKTEDGTVYWTAASNVEAVAA